jgi:hypothetical protein
VAVPRITQEAEAPDQMEENEVTRPSDLGFGPRREIEVDRVRDVTPQVPANDGTVEIRMNQTIEEFTYGNPHISYRLEQGKIYRVPRHIAAYLDSLGYVWH